MRNSYVFPAVLTIDDDGVSVEFPDLPGCFTCGDSVDEALKMAKDALMLHLYGLEEDKDTIPEPSSIADLVLLPKQIPSLIEVWMPSFRDRMYNKSVKKTLTLPAWLNQQAEEAEINFSQLLQDALKEKLGVYERPDPAKHYGCQRTPK